MNLWKCDDPTCKHSCIGIGRGIGLRAIGWYVKVGSNGKIFCPQHNPEKRPYINNSYDINAYTAYLQRLCESTFDIY
jgi:hypothetical protein